MSRDEILGQIQAILTELFEVEPSKAQLEAHLIHDLDLDSIDAIDMAVKLQELTGRQVPEEALKQIRTIKDIVDLVEAELARG